MAGSEHDEGRRSDPHPLGEVIRGVLGAGPLRAGVALGRLARAWDQVVGERLAGRSRPLGLERDVLTVSADNSSWAAQATFLAGEICRRANEVLGSDQVVSVRVVVASPAGRRGVQGGSRGPGSVTPR
jgi:predicted nucleic acid-binding Zn ribbon protein